MSDRRDENFPSPFDGLELGGGGKPPAPDKKGKEETSEDGREVAEKPVRLSRKQIRAIKKEVENAEDSLAAYLEEVKTQDLSVEAAEDILQRLEKYCTSVATTLGPIKEDELAVKWADRKVRLEQGSVAVRKAIATGDLAKTLEGLAPVIAFFANLEPVEAVEPPKKDEEVTSSTSPAVEAVHQPAAFSTKDEIFQAIEANKGMTLLEPVDNERELRTKIGTAAAQKLVSRIFSEFEDPRFKKRNPAVEKRRQIVDGRLRRLGFTKEFGEGVILALGNSGVFIEIPTQPEVERATKESAGVVFDFNGAETLEAVYQMLEENGDELVAVPSAPGSVRRNEMVSAKDVASRLRVEIPRILDELVASPSAERSRKLKDFIKSVSTRGHLNDAVEIFLRSALREAKSPVESIVTNPTRPETKEALDFDEAATLSEVYRILEEMGSKTFMIRARGGNGVVAEQLISADTVLDNLKSGIPRIISELRSAAIAERKGRLDDFFKGIPSQHNLRSAVKVFVKGYLRENGVELKATPQAIERQEAPEATSSISTPEAVRPLRVRKEKLLNLHELGWPNSAIRKLGEDGVKSVLATQKRYIVLTPGATSGAVKVSTVQVAPPPAASAPSPAPMLEETAPADLSRLMPRKPDVAAANAAANVSSTEAAGTATTAAASVENLVSVLDDPEFRTFIAKAPNAEALIERQDAAEIGLYKKAFEIKNKLAADLYELANGAIKGDFLLDFENPASNLPKNAKAEFQRYVDAETLERPGQLLKLAENLQLRQVLEKNIATAKAEIDRLGGKQFFEEAETEALYLKQHLERAHESTRRDSVAGYIPQGIHLGFLKMMYTAREWAGWKGQTEGSVKEEFEKKREALLNGRAEADLMVWEKLRFDKIQQNEAAKLAELKRHEALGERMVQVSQWGLSREKLKGDGLKFGLGTITSYGPWIEHPGVARELEGVNMKLAEIRQKKQTIEQAEKNLADISAHFEAIRTSTYAELPPTIALVKYAQAQIKNTLTSFTADTAIEDLERIHDYAALLSERNPGTKGANTGAGGPFESAQEEAVFVNRLHEAIVAKWGKRLFEVFANTAINKKGAIGEMEKSVKALLGKETIGVEGRATEKAVIVKGLLVEAFKKIDPTKGDGKERRIALVGVMISCGLLKKGEKITT